MNSDIWNPLPMLDTLRQANLGERAIDEAACRQEAALEHRPGAPGDSDVARLEGLKGEERGVESGSVTRERGTRGARFRARPLRRCLDWFRSRPNSVTAPAMASSRQRFSVRKSSVLIGAFSSIASSVMDWQTSP